MKKSKNKNINTLLIILAIIIVILAVLCLLPKKNNKINNELLGTWTTDGVTKYKFDNDNTGALMLPLNSYEFTYEIKGNKLSIDFENEKSEDSTFTYYFKDDKLILDGDNGKFTFTKVVDKKKS